MNRHSFAILCSVALLVVACGGAPTDVENFPTPRSIRAAQALESALREAGLDVVQVERTEEGDSVVYRWQIGGEPLLVMEGDFSRFAAAGQELDQLVGSGALVWSGPEMSVAYAGSDGGVRLVLDALLGDPLDQRESGQSEPYPPAVLAALRQVAHLYDRSPSDLQVESFEERTWPDGCLGLTPEPQAGACTTAEVPGWIVRINVDDQIVMVRSDELGSRVRVESQDE